jgi:hypothetical protein
VCAFPCQGFAFPARPGTTPTRRTGAADAARPRCETGHHTGRQNDARVSLERPHAGPALHPWAERPPPKHHRYPGKKSGRRVSNPRQPAWKAGALPTELLPPAALARRPGPACSPRRPPFPRLASPAHACIGVGQRCKIGAAGLEPATSCSQNMRANQTAPRPGNSIIAQRRRHVKVPQGGDDALSSMPGSLSGDRIRRGNARQRGEGGKGPLNAPPSQTHNRIARDATTACSGRFAAALSR